MPKEIPKIENSDQREKILAEYSRLMAEYKSQTEKVRKLEQKRTKKGADQALDFDIQETDKERHQTHLRLIDLARNLDKTKDDVLVDIIRWENSLKEFGLPEFSILKSSDIVDTEGFHSAIQFNIDEDSGKPSTPLPLDKPFDDYEFGKETYDGEAKRVLSESEILIVFSINPIEGYGDEEVKPEDYEKREKRAEALAEEVEGEYFDNYQGGYHGTSAHIIGVVIPKTSLEKVAGVIRDNPKRFRLGREFY